MVDGRVDVPGGCDLQRLHGYLVPPRGFAANEPPGTGPSMPRRNVAIEPLIEAMKVAAAALRDAEIKFALAGGLAIWARGGPVTDHDVDILVKPGDAERAQQALTEAGMRPERPPEDWLL